MYNSGRRGKRASDGYGIISQADKFYQTEYSIPVVTSFAVTDGSYVPLDDTAVDTAGGQTIVLYGSGFAPGATVTVGGVTIGAVTYLDQGRLTFTAPAKSSGSYTVVVINSNGGAGILVPGLVYSGVPTWSTSAGSVGSSYERTNVSSTFVATGDAPMTYSVLSGSLPPGTTLSTTGVLSGSAPVESGSTTYSFTIRATDGQLQDTDRSFSLTINTDVVTMSSPTNNQVITSYEYTPISNVTVAGTSAAGFGVVYSANAVPTGITLNATSGVISGTANAAGNTYTRLTATANTTSRTATRDVVFNVNQDVVTWNTPTNNYTISAYEYSAISNVTANATSAAGFGVLYSANTTPTGITLDANTGLISGTPTTVGNTYSLLTATANTTTRSNTRNVIYNVNQDVVTWSSPADGTSYSLTGGSAIANVTLAATSAAGKTITYTANALPSGLGISGNVIYGTPDTAQTVTTLLTATAATTNRSATRTISWTINIGDIYWNYTSLLLNANTPTPTFINDASLNNNQLSIFGDTKPNKFNPYQNVYYSNYFDGTGDYLSCAVNNSSLTNWYSQSTTIEAWIYPTSSVTYTNNYPAVLTNGATGSSSNYWGFGINGLNLRFAYFNGAGQSVQSTGTVSLNTWTHIAFVYNNSDSSIKLFINGVLDGSATKSGTPQSDATLGVLTGGWNGGSFAGYISNLRVLTGTALYTTTFTPPTNPLTTISGTSLLTCQSNRLIDNSVNNFTITKNGDTTVSPAHPFTTPTTAAYNTQYSVTFDGNGDYLTIPSSSQTDISSGDFTVEGWFYTKVVTGDISQYFADSYFNGVNRFMIYTYNNALYAQWISGGVGKYINTTIVINTWYHIAFVKNGTSYKLYLNGTSVGTPITDANSLTSGNTAITIGYSPTGGGSVNGYISNFRIVKGTAVYTANFTPSTTPLTAIANTVVLTCQDSTIKDNSTNNFAITSTAQAQPIALSPFTMTTSNTTVTSLGSAYFDGTSDVLTLPASRLAQLGTSNFTMEAWVYTNTIAAGASGVFDMWNGGQTSFLLRRSASTWQFYVSGGSNIQSATVVANT